ncbi:hypothetical protein [Mucilaginibacter myungsuensis]|uniref:MG2 domain-containing protein n=1 Tax=Mucilaginibacter myungsuensis TaxID=649104 RepID=A0A929PY76_9SPHI|nr:hypothetical protein [Mucilaginibacter myungsuensis]MBE9663889.1 hypothetical protein [Mucilaginibacter myungsuensis]MDN3598395.1 hypothetical protein [Mucilaginibacter myungsuensis]
MKQTIGIHLKRSLASLLFIASAVAMKAQSTTDTVALKNMLSKVEKYSNTYNSEKVYLHFDKPYYAVGDTAWFKSYVLNGDAKGQSAKSAKLYVELIGADNLVVTRLVLPIFDGLGQGYLALDDKTVGEGNYTIRAYTNWLQNFGGDYFFYKQLSIGNLGGNSWLLSEQHKRGTGVDSGKIELAMRLNTAKGLPLVQQKVSIKMLDGTKTILKSETSTDVQGTIINKLSLPPKANRSALSILIEDPNNKSQKISFPFYPSGAGGDIDLQFLPEGGSLVAGLYSKVGFKAIGEDGLSRDVKGAVYDSKGEEVASLQTVAKGLGSLMMVPKAGETYTAKIMVDGKEKTYKLPVAKPQGIALRVDGVNHADEVYVYLSSAVPDDKKYTLVARSRDKVYMGSGFTLNAEGYFNTRIKKRLFPTGIISLMVVDPNNKPIAQRNVFIDHHDALQVSVSPSKAVYATADSVGLSFKVTDAVASPVQGSFSVSVTDDAQVKDSVQHDNIQSHLLLASELKGSIEDPAWYFTKGDEKRKVRTLDNLLITQGWQGFDLENAVKPITDAKFKAEPQISINGKLTNFFGKPAVNKKVIAMTANMGLSLLDTISDTDGRFKFDDLPLSDSATYVIKVHEPNGKSAAVGIEVDEFEPTRLPLPKLPTITPWNLNSDNTLLGYFSNARKLNAISTLPIAQGTLLKDVTIKEKKVAISGVNGEVFFPDWDIDVKELIKEPRISLLRFLEKNYALATKPVDGQTWFFVRSARLYNIVIDGIEVSRFLSNMGPESLYKNFRAYLEHYYTDDIKHVYSYNYMVWVKTDGILRLEQRSVLVLDTRSGAGPMLKDHYGLYVYRPLPMQLPKQFYSPKYNLKPTTPDLRSTIYWEPNLVTDEQGDAKVSFYAADRPGSYTVNIEGTDMQGHFGVSKHKVIVAGPSPNKIKP